MGMDGLVPTFSVNGDGNGYNGGGWGDAVGAFAGALIGSWWGNGWGGGFGNGGGNGGCCGSAPSAPSVVIAGGAGGCGSTAELDALTGLQASVNSLGLQSLQGQNTTNMAMCQGFSGVVAADNANTASLMNATTQGFAGLNTAIMTGDQGIQQSLCQGFNGLNTAVLVSSKDAALQNCQSTNQLTNAIDSCCCTTQRTIAAEGSATRALVSQLDRERLLTQICDLKSENSSLKNQNFTTAAISALGSQLRTEMQQYTLNIIGHMAVIPRPTSGTATAAA